MKIKYKIQKEKYKLSVRRPETICSADALLGAPVTLVNFDVAAEKPVLDNFRSEADVPKLRANLSFDLLVSQSITIIRFIIRLSRYNKFSEHAIFVELKPIHINFEKLKQLITI